MINNAEGRPRAALANVLHALRKAPEFQGMLGFNQMTGEPTMLRPPPWEQGELGWKPRRCVENDDRLLAEALQHLGIMVSDSMAATGVETISREHPFHPVRDYISGLTWDGVSRIDRWLSKYLGAPDSPYHRAIGPRWLISAVARVCLPGCQADCMLILEGSQGGGKSSAVQVVGTPWFTDRLSDFGSKDAAVELCGAWIIEVAELDSMSRSEVSAVKAFVTCRSDRYRPPYGRRVIEQPRQCIFVGTVNPEGGYLKDPTGGRRFWPVSCGKIDLASLTADRDQLWAEAYHRFKSGCPWWLDTPELEALAATEQAKRYQEDTWDSLIRTYLARGWGPHDHGFYVDDVRNKQGWRLDVSLPEILGEVLGLEKGHWDPRTERRVVRCLVQLGFERYRASKAGGAGVALQAPPVELRSLPFSVAPGSPSSPACQPEPL